jgi:hypothetical protein
VAVDEAGNAVTYNGSSWSAPTSIDSGHALASVSCTSSSFCVALAKVGYAMTYNAGAWSAPADIDGADGLTSVSCPSASFCVAVGGDFPTNDGGAGAMIFSGSSWSAPAKIATFQMHSVSCPTSSFCTAAGHEAEAVSYKDGSWGSGGVISHTSMEINGVSCASESFCAAVDSFGNALTFNGSSWSPQTPSASALASVSCASSSFCVALSNEGAITYNGSSWSAPLASVDGSSVSCPEISFCVAVNESDALVYSTPLPIVPPALTPTSTTSSVSSSTSPSTPLGEVDTSASAITAALSAALNLKSPPTIHSLLKSGSYSIGFTSPGPGQLVVQWSTVSAEASKHGHAKPIVVATGSKTFDAAGRGVVTLHLTAAGRKLLKKAKTLRMIAVASFKPNSGSPQTKQATLTIREGHTARR